MLPAEGGVTRGGWCYPRRVVLPAEGGVTRGGWCYPRRVVLPAEGGVTREGWCYPWWVVLPGLVCVLYRGGLVWSGLVWSANPRPLPFCTAHSRLKRKCSTYPKIIKS